MIELRLRTRTSAAHIQALTGKVLGPADYDVLLTGAATVRKPDGRPLAVYLPGALTEYAQDETTYAVLHSLKTATSSNRGLASGSRRLRRGTEGAYASRTESLPIASAVIGSVDPMGQQRYCRLTAWTGRNLPAWEQLHPMLRAIADRLAAHVPDRYAVQAAEIAKTDPAWVVPGTPFTTVTVNNCVDAATECLTRRAGWTTYQHLQPDDEILAFDPLTQVTRWERLQDVFVNEHYSGEMVKLSARGFSALTTPDHRWPVQPPVHGRDGRIQRAISVKLTSELDGGYWSLLRSAPHQGPELPTYSDEFVRLAAWYMTEGTLTRSGTSVALCQSDVANPVHVEDIRRDLKALGARPFAEWRERRCIADQACTDPVTSRGRCNRHACQWRYQQRKAHGADFPGKLPAGPRAGESRRQGLWFNEYRHGDNADVVVWVLTGSRVAELLAVIPGKRKVPTMEFLTALTPEQAQMFVEICIAADGSPEYRRFYQHDAGRMDAFVAAAVLAGYAPALDSTGTHCFLRQPRSVTTGARIAVKSLKHEPQHYEGVIWCPSVPSTHWVARRAGTVYLTGNTYPTGVHTDKGDLEAGFSTIACLRRGTYTGGQLVFPEYRVAVDMKDGDLLLMDAHDWHGNCALVCGCGDRLTGPCAACGAERISVVSYMRSKVAACGSPAEEAARALAGAEKRSKLGEPAPA